MALWSVFEYYLVAYRRVWRATTWSSFVLPLLTMLGFGLGVGSYVSGGVDGVRYLDWIVPGLMAQTAMQTALGETSWPVLSKFEWIKLYLGQVAAPLRVADILGGQTLFVLFRVLIAVAAFLGVAALFGAAHNGWAVLAVPAAVLTGLAVAMPMTAFSASIMTDSYLAIVIRLGIVPMSLFSGVFFPLHLLPPVLQVVAWVLPLWHGVDLCRAATLGDALPAPILLAHLGVLALWAGVGWALALGRFRARLVY
jgi:lipooligosaccharide transport system permease protein